MVKVWLSGGAALAVVEDNGGYFSLHVRDEGFPIACQRWVADLLAQQAPDLLHFESEDLYPFATVSARLIEEWRRERSFRLLLLALDRELSRHLRLRAGQAVNELLMISDIRSSVRNRLLSAPFPSGDTELNAIHSFVNLTSLLHEVDERQSAVNIVVAAWQAACLNSELSAEEGMLLRRRCVAESGFAQMVESVFQCDRQIASKWLATIRHAVEPSRVASLFWQWHYEILKSIPPLYPERSRNEDRGPDRAFRQFLDSLKLGPIEDAVAQSPPEIQNAFEQFRYKYAAEPQNIESITRQASYNIATVPYSAAGKFSGLQPEHQKMLDYFHSLSDSDSRFGRVEEFKTAGFEEVLEHIRVARFVILSFLFLTRNRRDQWGVIPLGRQEAIGFVFHKENKVAADILNDFRAAELDPSGEIGSDYGGVSKLLNVPHFPSLDIEGTHLAASAGQRLTSRLIKAINRSKGQLYYMRGDAQKDIVEQILADLGQHDERGALPRILHPISESSGNVPLFYKLNASGVVIHDPGDKLRTDIHTFDPAHLPAIINSLGPSPEGYRVVCVRHGLDIPVGLGYSLAMLPYLLTTDLQDGLPFWQKLQERARNLYLRPEVVSTFGQAGIVLTPNQLNLEINTIGDILNQFERSSS
jgi:hypothetical protein